MHRLLLACLLGAMPLAAAAQEANDSSPLALHGQATWIRQYKPSFDAAYSGPQSLRTGREWSYSFTTTLDVGARLWRGAQVHVNPEWVEGHPLSNLTGAGALSNAELQRGAAAQLRSYRARMYFQQRFDAGGDTERIDPGFNEVGGVATQRRWTFTAGTISLLDFFDPNPYAKDPREQFTNWAFLVPAGWDYAADARGYTSGAMLEYRAPTWAARGGRFMQPRVSNGLQLEHDLARQWGDQLEIESDLPVRVAGGPLRARLTLFHNRIDGARFDEAIALAGAGVPDLAPARRLNDKRGWAATLQWPLAEDAGLFVRASRSDGHVETYAFAEIDGQLSVGSQFTGARWGRPNDRWGVAYAVNSLSRSHRDYLARGGTTVFVGDGRLAYAPERVVEGYYRWVLPDVAAGPVTLHNALSAGVQRLANPAYNQDRGPVTVWMARWHADF